MREASIGFPWGRTHIRELPLLPPLGHTFTFSAFKKFLSGCDRP